MPFRSYRCPRSKSPCTSGQLSSAGSTSSGLDAGRITEVDFVLDRHKLTRLSAHNKEENAMSRYELWRARHCALARRPSADTPRPL